MDRPLWKHPLMLAVASAATIGLFFLLREHWAHASPYLPYLVLLACPLMHLLHGHGGHDKSHHP